MSKFKGFLSKSRRQGSGGPSIELGSSGGNALLGTSPSSTLTGSGSLGDGSTSDAMSSSPSSSSSSSSSTSSSSSSSFASDSELNQNNAVNNQQNQQYQQNQNSSSDEQYAIGEVEEDTALRKSEFIAASEVKVKNYIKLMKKFIKFQVAADSKGNALCKVSGQFTEAIRKGAELELEPATQCRTILNNFSTFYERQADFERAFYVAMEERVVVPLNGFVKFLEERRTMRKRVEKAKADYAEKEGRAASMRINKPKDAVRLYSAIVDAEKTRLAYLRAIDDANELYEAMMLRLETDLLDALIALGAQVKVLVASKYGALCDLEGDMKITSEWIEEERKRHDTAVAARTEAQNAAAADAERSKYVGLVKLLASGMLIPPLVELGQLPEHSSISLVLLPQIRLTLAAYGHSTSPVDALCGAAADSSLSTSNRDGVDQNELPAIYAFLKQHFIAIATILARNDAAKDDIFMFASEIGSIERSRKEILDE